MEIEFSSYKLDEGEWFFSQPVLVFLLTLGLFLLGHSIVFANPSSNIPVEKDSKIPLSKGIFDSSGEWRASKKPEDTWRESEEQRLTIKKDRIRKKSAPLYGSPKDRDNWDPYDSPGDGNNMLTKPAKIFEFRF
jgi:hypothetical protein